MNTNSYYPGLTAGILALGLIVLAGGAVLSWRRRPATASLGTQGEIQDPPNPAHMEQDQDGAPVVATETLIPGKARLANRPMLFFLVLIVITIPYWIFGGKNLPIPIKLPLSAFAAFNPMIAAAILAYLDERILGVKALFSKALDFRNIKNGTWYIPILFFSPLVYVLAYTVMRFAGMPLPEPEIQILMVPVFMGVFILFGIGEELGWMGYAFEPMQSRWGALAAAVILGIFWGLFHLIPDLQNNQSAEWILWQRLGSVFLRILMVWIYNNTGKCVFSAVLFHATNNLSWSLFPNFGSHYDPMITCLILILVTVPVLIGWDEKTMTRFRFAGKSSN